MKHMIINVSFAAVMSAGTATAAPIDAMSEIFLSHSWLINSGNVPDGIKVENLSNTLVIDSEISTMIDDPTAEETVNQNFVVGNPFSDPPVAVDAERIHFTTVDDKPDFAAAIYSYTIESEDDPDDGVFDITRRDIDQYGLARVNTEDNLVDASAMSSHVGGREFRFVNTSDDLISFNLVGALEAELTASFDGAAGVADATAGFGLLFEGGLGASVNYFPIAPYLTTTVDSDPGSIVEDLFLANSGGITGVSFDASVSATGDGGLTEAAFFADTRYIFTISLEQGASISMVTSFYQSNSVVAGPVSDIPPVPLPASLPMLLAGLAGFGFLRHKRGVLTAGG